MALFYLVRHGEANYDHMLESGFWGFGRSFAPLSEKGKQQAEITAKDIRLKNAQLIVSSPYTRALQTAQIISRETGIRVEVEIDLREWEPDESNQYKTSEESFALAREFTKYNGEYPPGKKFRWESLNHMRKRMIRVADKYSDYDTVIFVGHGMAFRCLTYIEKMAPAEIIECTYQRGQAECSILSHKDFSINLDFRVKFRFFE